MIDYIYDLSKKANSRDYCTDDQILLRSKNYYNFINDNEGCYWVKSGWVDIFYEIAGKIVTVDRYKGECDGIKLMSVKLNDDIKEILDKNPRLAHPNSFHLIIFSTDMIDPNYSNKPEYNRFNIASSKLNMSDTELKNYINHLKKTIK